jgi:ubiquitin C-terminal hydrolase
MPSKINTGVSSEQENASRGVKCAPKTVLKNEGPPKSRLTRKKKTENGKRLTECIYKLNGDEDNADRDISTKRNLSSTDESINSRKENCHVPQEKLGKKDPETPKQNSRFGQFQQFPTIPLSTKPDFVKSKSKRSIHPACSESHKKKTKKVNACSYNEQKPGKMSSKMNTSVSSEQENASRVANGTRKTVLKNKGPPKTRLTRRERIENRKKCTEWIYKHDGDEEDNDKRDISTKRKSSTQSSIKSKRKKLNELINSSDDEDVDLEKFVGLRNKRNDCWLNTLVQCMNSIPLRICMLDEMKKNTKCKVTSALMKVISKMTYVLNGSFYPHELHKAIQDEYKLVPGEQQDIHEIFTRLCSSGTQNMNDIIAIHFQSGCQFTKTCRVCAKHDDLTPETRTTIILPVLNGIHNLERSIVHAMNDDHVPIYCSSCENVTANKLSGNFVFLPQTLVIGFNRFQQKGGIAKKNHSRVQLPLELQVVGNMPCQYGLKACALHHGMHIHNGHYTAVIFDNGKVIEMDDHIVKDVTDDWKSNVQSTVYLAFYTKKYTSLTHSTQLDYSPNSDNDDNKREEEDRDESLLGEYDQGSERSTNETENIERFYDISCKYKSISTKHKVGYTLVGSDFKTLEFPVINNSYSLEEPGWLNDNIIDAYLLLLVKACSQKGIRVYVLNSFFYLRIRNAMLKKSNEKKIYEIISRTRQMVDYEACDYILIPINIHNHWTAVVINIWNTQMFYYDPIGKGIQNETVIKLFKVFFDLFYQCHKTCDIQIESKGFIKDFDVIWE